MGYSERKRFRRTLSEARALMKSIAKRENLKLVFLTKDEGNGGYNYGGSSGDSIMLAPFVKGRKGDKVKGYELIRDCDNPVECMLIAFFHELAHCILANKVPSRVRGYAWNDTPKMQYELWITMLGVEYAHSKYGIKFSDQSVKWLIDENASYMVGAQEVKEQGYGLVCTKATSKSCEDLSQWEFTGDEKKRKGSK